MLYCFTGAGFGSSFYPRVPDPTAYPIVEEESGGQLGETLDLSQWNDEAVPCLPEVALLLLNLLLLYCCFTAAILRQGLAFLRFKILIAALRCFDALLLLHCCIIAALLLLYCCFGARRDTSLVALH
jgi:hypothetical protein